MRDEHDGEEKKERKMARIESELVKSTAMEAKNRQGSS